MPILPGDELSGDCQYVGNTPIQPHKAEDGTLARATAADLDAVSDDVEVIRTGMVVLSSRKQAYIDAYAALGLGVCDEEDRPFAGENAPLMIRFEELDQGLQVWLTGRDFVDYAGDGSEPEYWQLAFDEVVSYAASHVAGRTKVVLLLDSTGGTYTADVYVTNDYFPNSTTMPAEWTLHIMDEAGGQVTAYFAGGTTGIYGDAASPDETAVLIIGDQFAGNDTTGYMATLAANASTIRTFLQAGVGLIGWSQLYLSDPIDPAVRGSPTTTGWSWLDDVLPGIIPVVIGTYPPPWVPLDAGEAKIPGMTDSINYTPGADSAQTGFSGDLNGLVVLATTGSGVPALGSTGLYNLDIGGVPNL